MQVPAPMQALLDVLSGRDDSPHSLDAAGWETLVAEASRHGVSALMFQPVAGSGRAPQQIVLTLEGHYLRNRLRNLRLYARLSALLDALAAQAIDVVVLKGAFLAQTVYGDAALRPMSDIDLLVRDRDLERAAQAMRTLGWNQSPPLSGGGGHQLPTFELAGVQIDLHWSIEDDAAPFAIDVAGLWQRTVPARVGQARALALSAEDLLLHLCLHTAYNHGWLQFDGGLRHVADIAAVVRHYDSMLDWSALADRAVAWQASRCVWLGLATVRDLLRADVPDAVLDRLAPVPPHVRWTAVARRLALGSHYAELARRLPVLGQASMNKRWRRLPRGGRWHTLLLPAQASLRRAYPGLEGHPALAHVAHWKDLAGEMLRIGLSAEDRALWSFERERRVLAGWLEGRSAP